MLLSFTETTYTQEEYYIIHKQNPHKLKNIQIGYIICLKIFGLLQKATFPIFQNQFRPALKAQSPLLIQAVKGLRKVSPVQTEHTKACVCLILTF